MYIPVLNIGDAVLSVPVSMDHVHPLPDDVKFEEADDFINIITKDANVMDTEASDTKGKQIENGKPDNDNHIDNDKPPLDPSDEDALESIPHGSLPMVRSYSLDLPTEPDQLQQFNKEVDAITHRILRN
jgi:hypothetical protein